MKICPKCAGNIKWTNEKLIEEINRKGLNITPLEDIVNIDTKIKFKCNRCSFIWAQTPYNLIRSQGCPECNNRSRWTENDFVERVNFLQPNVHVSGFLGILKPINCKCKVCGNEWHYNVARELLKRVNNVCKNCQKIYYDTL